MDQKALLDRIAVLEKDQERLLANAHAVEGAILDCRYWLAQLAEKNKEGAPEGASVSLQKQEEKVG